MDQVNFFEYETTIKETEKILQEKFDNFFKWKHKNETALEEQQKRQARIVNISKRKLNIDSEYSKESDKDETRRLNWFIKYCVEKSSVKISS